MKDLEYYCQAFVNLSIYKNNIKGKALNKPILLFSVINFIANNIIQENHIEILDELIHAFEINWKHLNNLKTYKRTDFVYPFVHLQNEGFWHIKVKDYTPRIQSLPKLRKYINHADLDEEIFYFLQEEQSRNILLDHLMIGHLMLDDLL